MRNVKKALMVVAATVVMIGSLAFLNFVREKMEANDRLLDTSATAIEYSAPAPIHADGSSISVPVLPVSAR